MSQRTFPWREILFTAKTGFLSKSLWREFFSTRSESRNSRVWRGFIQSGYFKKHDSKMLPDVLVLGKAAELELEKRGIQLVGSPHLALFDHDEKAARILLQLLRSEVLDSYTTEAELKRRFMVWLKTSREGKEAKFPDLTLLMKAPCRFRRVALEVEQSMKSQERYRKMMKSYSVAKDIDTVIFISDHHYIFGRIARAMKETHYPSWERPVGFAEMSAWLKDPLAAPIFLSREVTSLRDWMAESHQKAA